MGEAVCLGVFCLLEVSDWIALLGVVVNAILTFWIVRTIQNRLTNKRVLKDHFINEIKDIRNEYKTGLGNLYSNKTHPHDVIPWLKLLSINIDSVMTDVHSIYNIDKITLSPYQYELNRLITDNPDFKDQFNSDKVTLTETSKNQLIKFQQSYDKRFNKLIVAINDAE